MVTKETVTKWGVRSGACAFLTVIDLDTSPSEMAAVAALEDVERRLGSSQFPVKMQGAQRLVTLVLDDTLDHSVWVGIHEFYWKTLGAAATIGPVCSSCCDAITRLVVSSNGAATPRVKFPDAVVRLLTTASAAPAANLPYLVSGTPRGPLSSLILPPPRGLHESSLVPF